ncbi:hypothetical protein Tco_1377296 [Tanacetum coccineum]
MLKELKKRIAEEQTAKENMSIKEMRHEQQLVDYKIKYITNDLGIKRFRGEEIDEEYKRDCEIRIRKLKQDFNEWGSEVRKNEQAYNEEQYAAARRGMVSITFDDEDDYISLGDIIARYSTSKAITPDLPIKEPDNSLTNFDPNDDTSSDDDSFENIEYVDASPSYSELDSLEEENEDQEEKEFNLEDIFHIQDVILCEKLLNVHRLISNFESLKDKPTPDHVLESPSPFPIPVVDSDVFFEESDTSLSYLDNSLPEFETFSDHTEETRSGSTTTHANYSLPEYDSFLFEIEPDQGGLTSVVISDNSNDLLLEIPEFESFHFDTSFPRPPPEPPDVEICLHFEPDAPVIDNFNELNEDQRGSEIIFLQNVEDDDSFTFVIWTFLPFLTYPEASPLSCSTGSEDTIFDPGIITFPFSYLEPVAFSMEVSCSKCCSP